MQLPYSRGCNVLWSLHCREDDADVQRFDSSPDTCKFAFVFIEGDFRRTAKESYGCETWSQTLREERKLRVFENKMLRRIFGPRRDEVTGDWRRLHNEELNDLYCSPNIVRVIKSRRMRWAGHVARMGEETGCIGSWWGNRRERDHWGDLGVDAWIILGMISKRWDVGIWTGLDWPRIETGGVRL